MFLDLGDCFLSYREVFSYYLFKYFLRSFLSLPPFWGPYDIMFLHLMLSSFLFILFSLCCSVAVISVMSSSSLIHYAASVILLIPSSIFFISVYTYMCKYVCVCVCVCMYIFGCTEQLAVSSQPETEPMPPAVEVRSPNHWTARRSPSYCIIHLSCLFFKSRILLNIFCIFSICASIHFLRS